MDSQKTVFTAAILTLGSTVAFSMAPVKMGGRGEIPSPKLLIGTSLSFMALGILGDFAPELAGPLSLAIAFTALTYYGLPIAESYFGGKEIP